MAEIRIFDSLFSEHAKSFTLRDENLDVSPKYLNWRNYGIFSSKEPVFFTDSHLSEVAKYGSHTNAIALLLEPPCLRKDHYFVIEDMKDFYRAILTYDQSLVDDEKWLNYFYGGSSIAFEKWGLYEKVANLSIIASDKLTTEGHKLRHEAIMRFGFDGVYGTGYKRIESKIDGLAHFRYSLVIESCKLDYYFTEKLIDCLCMGTVPIYWGCPSIGKFFNPDGIIPFDNLEDLNFIFNQISEKDYQSRFPAILDNIQICRKYAIAEDWIWENHQELFK